MKILRREFLQMAAASLASPAVLGTAKAQAWPAKALRVIIPTGAGSAADVVPRIILEAMSAKLGKPIVVENWPEPAEPGNFRGGESGTGRA